MKRLIFRLSSLGDLILSQSVLEAHFEGETHWVVAKEFEGLVIGHPKITKVWSFDRRSPGGLRTWLTLLAELRLQQFDEVLDIHSTWRTVIARLYFRIYSSRTRWKKISKSRLRRVAYEILKGALPSALRPDHFSERCVMLAGGPPSLRPDLRWMLSLTPPSAGRSDRLPCRIGLVPSSAWNGKEWPTFRYVEWATEHLRSFPHAEFQLFGTPADRAATALRAALTAASIPVRDGIGKFSLRELAAEFATCVAVVGSDTGLLHLAESIGTPVVTIYGPTRADFGFGPLDPRSCPVETDLWCSPCSKDGSLCFRPIDRYKCLRVIPAGRVSLALERTSVRAVTPPPTETSR